MVLVTSLSYILPHFSQEMFWLFLTLCQFQYVSDVLDRFQTEYIYNTPGSHIHPTPLNSEKILENPETYSHFTLSVQERGSAMTPSVYVNFKVD